MPSTPNKLQVGTNQNDAYALLNDNFDSIAQDLRDFGSSTSSQVTVPFTIGASSVSSQVVVLVSLENTSNASAFIMRTKKPVSGLAVASAYISVFVDGTAPSNQYFFGSLTNAQNNFHLSVTAMNATYNNSLASFLIQIVNRDTSSHTYSVNINSWYIPIAGSTNFR